MSSYLSNYSVISVERALVEQLKITSKNHINDGEADGNPKNSFSACRHPSKRDP